MSWITPANVTTTGNIASAAVWNTAVPNDGILSVGEVARMMARCGCLYISNDSVSTYVTGAVWVASKSSYDVLLDYEIMGGGGGGGSPGGFQ